MPIVLISDIHGNLEALQAVLGRVDRTWPTSRIVCCGDIVGYGPDPEACIETLRERSIPCVVGNHEELVLGTRDFSTCVYAGIIAAVWTRKSMSAASRKFLESLPKHIQIDRLIVTHGDLLDADTYVSSAAAAAAALVQMKERYPSAELLACGHTHHAAVFSEGGDFRTVSAGSEWKLANGRSYVVNPGAVGQSRDDTPTARFAVYDPTLRTVGFAEQDYDYEQTLYKLKAAGLPPAVILTKPTGLRRYIEGVKRRWARYRAERTL